MAAMSSSLTSPLSLWISTVVGASVPAANSCSISLKPSTESTDSLKKVVVE